MSLSYTYSGTAITHGVPPSLISIPQRAENGEASFGTIPFEDPGATLTLVGHRPFIVAESACSQPRLFTGYVAQRDIGRSYEQGQFVGEDARLMETSVVDQNAALGFIVISGTAGNRPEESWNDRLAWLMASDYLSPFIGGGTAWLGSYEQTMDAADYRGGYAKTVLEDLKERTGGVLNYFLAWDPDTSNTELFLKREQYTTGLCTLSISNDPADIDFVTVWPPDQLAKLTREPDQVYSEVIVQYNGGQVYRSLADTATTYTKRGSTINRPYTKRASTAVAQADQWLAAHSMERDRITCVMRSVPADSVGLVRAGMGMEVKFSHLPDYSADYVEMRIVMCSPVPVSDIGDLYDISLELVGPRPEPATTPLNATLFRHYDCDDGSWGDGAQYVDWANTGDVPPSGFSPEPKSGAVDYLDQTVCDNYAGFVLTADAVVSIDMFGRFGGVSTGSSSITVTLRQNGTIIETVTFSDSRPAGLYYYSGSISMNPSGITGLNGDEFALGVVMSGWAGFPYFGYKPADTASQTHFRISGESGAQTTGDTIVPTTTTPTTVIEDTAPTEDDDEAHGFKPGDIWIDTTTGIVYILVDSSTGAATWTAISGNISDHGDLTGLADDDHTQYVLKTDGGKEVVNTVAAAGATETLDLADGNVHDITLNADCTLTFTGATNGVACSFSLILRQDGTGGWTTTWPGSVIWAGGSAPTLDETASTAAVLTFVTVDGGSNWFGFPTGGGGEPATTVESETTWGITPAVGTDTEYARQDHTHGSMSAAVISAAGFVGEILVTDTPSGTPIVFADLIVDETQLDLVYGEPT